MPNPRSEQFRAKEARMRNSSWPQFCVLPPTLSLRVR
jgi:hypothetical protein